MIKIQLDNAALSKLIENGGEEFELEIRNGVLSTVLKKFMDKWIPEKINKIINIAANDAIDEKIGKITYNTTLRKNELNLTKDFSNWLQTIINNMFLDHQNRLIRDRKSVV